MAIWLGLGYYLMFNCYQADNVMAFNVRFEGNIVRNIKSLVSLPRGAEADLQFQGNSITDCENVVEQRDEQSVVEAIGLPADTPIEQVLEVLTALRDRPEANAEQVAEIVKNSKLWAYVERSASAATVIQSLVGLAATAFGISAT
ncbi:hypothetical protein [Pseudomonas lactis]|uniref:hypothetical protein n=1 Tax=Pseudomonas lactis TaxID=1615674 RepID=UPI001186C318|nr:hypothetical protein [Pseudomonas lactis]